LKKEDKSLGCLIAAVVFALLIAALFSHSSARGAEQGPKYIYSSNSCDGLRNVTVVFRHGEEPDIRWSGPTPGVQITGFLGEPSTGYSWRFIWAPEEPAPWLDWTPVR
jgi:hypothetical protein